MNGSNIFFNNLYQSNNFLWKNGWPLKISPGYFGVMKYFEKINGEETILKK